MTRNTLRIDCDPAPLIAALDGVTAVLASAPERGPEIFDLLFGPPDGAQDLAVIEVDRAASGDLTVRMLPGYGLRRLLAATGVPDVA